MLLKPPPFFSTLQVSMLFLLLPFMSYSQSVQYTAKVSLAVETYAFLRGQSEALVQIAGQFPNLQGDVLAAEKRLNDSFGRAERNIEQFLKEELRDSHFKILKKQIDSLLQEQFKKPIEREQYARDFLARADQRASPMRDTLLHKRIMAFRYLDAPDEEIKDGHLIFFSTQDHPKSQHADLKIPVPKSWLAQEAESLQTIQQFTSCNGTGMEKILITAYDLPEHLHNIILTTSTVSEMLSPHTRLIRGELTKVDGMHGMIIETEEKFHSGNIAMKVRMLQFMVVHGRKLYSIQGSVGPVEAGRNLEMHLKEYEPLFRLVAAGTEIGN